MTAYAVLLRGVNVGGRSLGMATFSLVLTGLGYGQVRTYLQSGNAVLTSRAPAAQVAAEVQAALAATTGLDVPVVVRTAAQLSRVVQGWPFEPDGAPTTRLVVFLRSARDATALVDLPLDHLLPDRARATGSEVYLSLPNGLGRSRLATLLAGRQRRLVATTRNWNTVTALRELTAGLG